MNLLPSMLIATALLGSVNQTPANLNTTDTAALSRSKSANTCINGQVISGSASNLESVLGSLGIQNSSLKNCIKFTFPNNSCPGDNKPGTGIPEETPDNGTPDDNENQPDTDSPNDNGNQPDTDAPDDNVNQPDTDVPDDNVNQPDADAPDHGTGKPDDNRPGTDQETDQSFVKQVVHLVNEERAKAGLSALAMTDELNTAALTRAKETTSSFSHTRPNGSSFSTVLSEAGIKYRGSGENIAWGQKTPEAVVNAWMNSEGHRANILNKNFTSIGVGYYLSGSTPYWTQLFTY